jgi:hypothetical protein
MTVAGAVLIIKCVSTSDLFINFKSCGSPTGGPGEEVYSMINPQRLVHLFRGKIYFVRQ